MRLKTKLVLAITGLVFAVVVVFLWIWLSQLLQQHLEQSFALTDDLSHQVSLKVNRALDSGLSMRRFDPRDQVAVRAAVADTLRENTDLNDQLNSIVEYSPTVLDIDVADQN